MPRHSDPLVTFSHRLTQIKFILLEIVIFLGFLMWLWDKAKHDIPFLDHHRHEISTPYEAPATVEEIAFVRRPP